MKKIIILSTMLGLIFAEGRKEHAFLSDVQVDNPHVQQEVDQLRQQYVAESNQIRAEYQRKIDALKKQRRSEIEDLKEAYKHRLKRLKQKHPKAFTDKPKVKPLKRVPQSQKLKATSSPDKKKSIK
jgi:membrane protein involved in colicin uptake